MKFRRVVWIALAILVLPSIIRYLWYFRGRYQPPEIPDVQEFPVDLPPLEYHPDVQEPSEGTGRVVIDMAHRNNLELDDIAPLRDRLVMYGATVETFDGLDSELPSQLVGATAYVVLAPTYVFSQSEREAVLEFIADGGKLLIAADPTRPVPSDIPPGYRDLYSALFPESAVPAVNSLANEFGVVYFDDYLYNLVENAGNYRDVFMDVEKIDHPLTTGISEIVLFSSHSMRAEGIPVLQGDKDTLSPLRVGETGLLAGALVSNEQVLTLGDISFMQPSYHVQGDNDRFLSNIARWLAQDERVWDIRDFPFLFSNPVVMVQLMGEIVDPRLVNRMDTLRELMEHTQLPIEIRESAQSDEDMLLLGTFTELESVNELLIDAGIQINLPSEDADLTEGEDLEIDGTETNGDPEQEPQSEIDGTIYVEGIGTFDIRGTALFVEVYEEEHVSVLVLAEDNPGIFEALDRLIWSDFSNCVAAIHIMICYGDDLADRFASDDEAVGGLDGNRVFILSDDDSVDGSRTGAFELQSILEEFYTVTVWSTQQDGLPTSEDIAGHDVYIIDTGDYVYDLDDFDTYVVISEILENIMYIGAQPTYYDLEPELVMDIEVNDSTHPLAAGFELGDVIDLLPSESGVPAIVFADEEYFYTETTSVVFARGPQSVYAGTPIVVAYDFVDINYRMIQANFAFYRLPEDAQQNFALNAVAWLLGE